MNNNPAAGGLAEHQDISMLLPWYVNGTLSAFDRQRVDSHVETCAACGHDLELERQIHCRMSNDAVVQHIPAASLKRLNSRLDSQAAGGLPAIRETRRFRRPTPPWIALMAASSAAIVVAFGLYMSHGQRPSSAAAPVYYTVTNSEPRPSKEVIRAVFASTITLVELQALLDEAQLNIISGPTEAGVYSLAARSSRPVGLSLGLLRQHGTVRFAEMTRDGPVKPEFDDAR